MSINDEVFESLGVDTVLSAAQLAYSIAADLDYNSILTFIRRIDEHIGDSVFSDRLLELARELTGDQT